MQTPYTSSPKQVTVWECSCTSFSDRWLFPATLLCFSHPDQKPSFGTVFKGSVQLIEKKVTWGKCDLAQGQFLVPLLSTEVMWSSRKTVTAPWWLLLQEQLNCWCSRYWIIAISPKCLREQALQSNYFHMLGLKLWWFSRSIQTVNTLSETNYSGQPRLQLCLLMENNLKECTEEL